MRAGKRRHLVVPHPVVQPATVEEDEGAARAGVRPDGHVAVRDSDLGSRQVTGHDTQVVIIELGMSTEVSYSRS